MWKNPEKIKILTLNLVFSHSPQPWFLPEETRLNFFLQNNFLPWTYPFCSLLVNWAFLNDQKLLKRLITETHIYFQNLFLRNYSFCILHQNLNRQVIFCGGLWNWKITVFVLFSGILKDQKSQRCSQSWDISMFNLRLPQHHNLHFIRETIYQQILLEANYMILKDIVFLLKLDS